MFWLGIETNESKKKKMIKSKQLAQQQQTVKVYIKPNQQLEICWHENGIEKYW